MTSGKDLSSLFPDVVQCIATNSLGRSFTLETSEDDVFTLETSEDVFTLETSEEDVFTL